MTQQTQLTKLSQPTTLTQPRISVIICAYTMERLNDIHEAINSLLAQTLKPYEIVISVDYNQELHQSLHSLVGSQQSSIPQLTEPGTPEIKPEIKVVLNTSAPGLCETRNVGIRAANGDIVAFIDDDAIAEPDWLENLVKPFSQQLAVKSQNPQANGYRVVAVGGKALPIWPNGKRPSWFPEELDWIIGCTYKGLPLVELAEVINPKSNPSPFLPSDAGHGILLVRNVPGCNMAFRKEIFEQVGYWSQDLGSKGQFHKGGEEAELCLRIKDRIPDSLILYEPNAVIYHKVPRWRATLNWVARHSFSQGIGKATVQKLSENLSQRSLSTEDSYLRHLLFQAVPERLRHFYKKGSLSHVGAIAISIVATGVGYVVGRIRR